MPLSLAGAASYLLAMLGFLGASAERTRLAVTRGLTRLGLREDNFLLLLAVLIGVVTAAAAVGFHELIRHIRNTLYGNFGVDLLYGPGLPLLVLLPAAGGLAVAAVSRYVFRTREGHGIVDVMESVIRSSGVIKPLSALEKIFTSGLTIGTGGSAGAEGPIVQIGAGIASGVGQLFRTGRQHLPVLIGCGSAAGISAIFNSPLGGVLFTLEVLLQDFSIRAFTPIVLASVIANITTRAVLRALTHGKEQWDALFRMPPAFKVPDFNWGDAGWFVVLGLLCGLVGLGLTRLTYWSEGWFARLKMPKVLKPALGGTILGLLGVAYVVVFGWYVLHTAKPFEFQHYPLPAFYSDGYGVIGQLIDPASTTYARLPAGKLVLLLGSLVLIKIVATCATLSSGGSGGIIAPSLFLGATAGGFLGLLLQGAGLEVEPAFFALVGMGAVLSAVVHAPLASILILMDLTKAPDILLPAMLTAVVATGTARLLFRDSIYTLTLRQRGVRVGSGAALSVLRRLSVEQVDLEPASVVKGDAPFQHVLDLMDVTGASSFSVADENGAYAGMVTADDVRVALLQREAVPLLVVRDVARYDVPLVRASDDLATVLDLFSRHDVSHLPVSVSRAPGKVIGLVSRAGLMRRYQKGLAES